MKKRTKAAAGAAAAAAGGLALLSAWKGLRREELRITAPEGIDEGEWAWIGGMEQYLYHRGRDRENPVLLFLHGGPGCPELPFAHTFQIPWEERLTVVHWDQRGAGKTGLHTSRRAVEPTLSLERMIEDLDEVVSHLKRKYHREKILLLGHSWGSVLGCSYVKRYPESVLAYIGVGQVVNMRENEYVGFNRAMEAAVAAGDRRGAAALRAMEPYPGDYARFIRHLPRVRAIQGRYGLAEHTSVKNVAAVATSLWYSLYDCTCFLRPGAMGGQSGLMEDLYDFDLPALGSRCRVPFFLIQGEEDWQTPYPLAKAYFETVDAPEKGFYSIPDAGHFTMLDQGARFTRALFEILDAVKGEDEPC